MALFAANAELAIRVATANNESFQVFTVFLFLPEFVGTVNGRPARLHTTGLFVEVPMDSRERQTEHTAASPWEDTRLGRQTESEFLPGP